MDHLTSAHSIALIFAPHIFNDTPIITWDNDTSGYFPAPPTGREQKYFWIAMSFVCGLAVGFMLYYLYYCLHRYLLSQIEDYPNSSRQSGVTNLSFIGDDSRSSFTDPPPDYATVVARNNEGDASPNQKEKRGLFARIFKSSSVRELNGSVVDAPPPSYSSVVSHLEVDFNNEDGDGLFVNGRRIPITDADPTTPRLSRNFTITPPTISPPDFLYNNKYVIIGVLTFFVTLLVLAIIFHVLKSRYFCRKASLDSPQYRQASPSSDAAETSSMLGSDDDNLDCLYTNCQLYVPEDEEVNTDFEYDSSSLNGGLSVSERTVLVSVLKGDFQTGVARSLNPNLSV